MQSSLTMEQLAELRGAPVYDSVGAKIGSVEEIFLDNDTNQPEWIGLGTGVFGTKRVLVPVKGAQIKDGAVEVAYAKDHVKDGPDIDADEISQETERELYAFYGLEYSERRSESGLPEGGAPPPPPPRRKGQDVTRAEEELQVGKRPVQAGTVRLRKWVETEPVTAEVDVKRETARIEREPINEPVGEGQMGEQQVEVPLEAEQPVVSKQTVAKERVSVDKDVETTPETVTEEVRKEQISLEGDDVETRRG